MAGVLAHVQAFLLVALYLQCTPYPRRCWNVVGMAHRMSVGLGLHLSQYIPELTLLEKEMRWRAWCACVQMDMYVHPDILIYCSRLLTPLRQNPQHDHGPSSHDTNSPQSPITVTDR